MNPTDKGVIDCPLHRVPRESFIRLSSKTGKYYFWCPVCGPVFAHGIDRAGGDDPDDFQAWIFNNGRFYGAEGDSNGKETDDPRGKKGVARKNACRTPREKDRRAGNGGQRAGV